MGTALPLIVLWMTSGFFYDSHAVSVAGYLKERGTRKPIEGANVYLLPHKLKAVTDARGYFTIPDTPEGPATWVVNSSGYRKLEKQDTIQAADTPENERILYVERFAYALYESTVIGKEDKRDDTTKTLKLKEFIDMPGSGGDPLKAVQNLPGIARPPAIAASVVIQGSAPADTRYTIDGHEVPIIFHFGGLSSVVLPEALDRVDYLSAGYGAEWGRANGGLVGLWTRSARTDRLHGFAYADLFNAGGSIEGKIDDKSSFLFGARQSYIGWVLGAVLPRSSSFNLSVAPVYTDAIGIYERKLTHRDDFKVVTAGSLDLLQFVQSQPVGQDPSIRGTFKTQNLFYRVIPQLVHRHSERTISRLSLGLGQDWVYQDIASNYSRSQTRALTLRAELEKKLDPPWLPRWVSQWGMDHRLSWTDLEFQLPFTFSLGGVANPTSAGQLRTVSLAASPNHVLGAYWRNEIKWSKESPWVLIPAVRADFHTLTGEILPVPRLATRYEWSEFHRVRLAGGLYAQPPTIQQQDSSIGNPNIKSPRAFQLSAGWEKDWREGASRGLSTSLGGFYREFWNLVIASSTSNVVNGVLTPEYFNNQGTGRAYGLETLVRLEWAPFSGWLAYTLSRSTRTSPPAAEALFNFDQTHLLTAMVGWEPGAHWKIGLRARVITGNPFTPVSSSLFDADNDVYFPIRGSLYSQRIEPFFQLDLRIDKQFIFDTFVLSAYLDILNLTNQMNPEAIVYSYDYATSAKISALPILPTLGLKAEF